jgi:hypothetical protein
VTTPGGWTVIDEAAGILTREYAFAPNATARMMVARAGPGELVAISPAPRMPDTAFDELDRYGRVTALVSPNGFHHMGLPEWKARYPESTVHAEGKGRARVARNHPALRVEGFDTLRGRLDGTIRVDALPGTRTGECWMRAAGTNGPVWYLGDTFMSQTEPPAGFLPRLIFSTLFKSSPGFRANRVCLSLLLTDKPAVRAWMLDELRREEPAIAVTAHGAVVHEPGLGKIMSDLIQDAMPG